MGAMYSIVSVDIECLSVCLEQPTALLSSCHGERCPMNAPSLATQHVVQHNHALTRYHMQHRVTLSLSVGVMFFTGKGCRCSCTGTVIACARVRFRRL
eukprot:m.490177 g.490177  ORF g.490177 m.490177 type:complete len:98 (+) comp27567_c0_seq1:135-428(+)